MSVSDTQPQECLFDLLSRDVIPNPYPHYDRIRAAAPVHWEPAFKAWIVSGFDAVKQVLTDDHFAPNDIAQAIGSMAQKSGKDLSDLRTLVEAILFFRHGEQHRQDRRTIARMLNMIPISEMDPLVRGFAKESADAIAKQTEFDAVKDYAELIPGMAMCHILGLPQPDVRLLTSLVSSLTLAFDVASLSLYQKLNGKAKDGLTYLSTQLEIALAQGRHTGLTQIYHDTQLAHGGGVREAAALTFFLFVAGFETTAALISACVNAVMQRPALYEWAREDPSRAALITAEVIRLESSVQRIGRIALSDTQVGDKTVKRGEVVVVLLGAANRDPAAFDDPTQLDPARPAVENMTFGAARHFCLGATLAKLEAHVALEYFLALPRIEVIPDGAKWYESRSIRKLASLPLRFSRTEQQ